MMKTRLYLVTLSAIALFLMSAAGANAQHEHHGQPKPPAQTGKEDSKQSGSMDMSQMMREPNHVLARAYLQNVATFARALRDQVGSAKSVDVDFARAAVAEMRRSFDAMQQRLTEHKKSMPADMQSHMGMMQDEHVTQIRQALELLERDVQADAPVASKLTGRADEIIKHIEMMATSHGGHKEHKM